MRGNLNWGNTNLGDGSNGVPNFQNLYAYGWDAMTYIARYQKTGISYDFFV